jgi:GAF domain-containing protein
LVYAELLRQAKGQFDGERDVIANAANLSALLAFHLEGLNWAGVYFLKGGELVLGPFQGPVACTRIRKGRGVCGTAWEKAETLIVPDVEKFPGHIACSSLSRSEIVVPLIHNGEVWGVLDADSEHLDHYDMTDKQYLEKISLLLASS